MLWGDLLRESWRVFNYPIILIWLPNDSLACERDVMFGSSFQETTHSMLNRFITFRYMHCSNVSCPDTCGGHVGVFPPCRKGGGGNKRKKSWVLSKCKHLLLRGLRAWGTTMMSEGISGEREVLQPFRAVWWWCSLYGSGQMWLGRCLAPVGLMCFGMCL